jgi:hypothetical protein
VHNLNQGEENMNKEQAFSEFVGTDYEEGSDENPINAYPNNVFEYLNEEYFVLTDEEADQMAREYILESLWAFNASFLIDYMFCLPGVSFMEFEMYVKQMQENMCEGCNSIIRGLIEDNIDKLIDDAIACDGRGHFIAAYDFEEHECADYFIYRIN